MAAVEGKGLLALVRRARIPASTRERGMKERKLNHIGIILSSDIAGTKVSSCLPGIAVQSVAINIENLCNLKPTAGLSMLKMHIITITWIGA